MRLAITNQGSETGVTTLSNLSDSFRSLRCEYTTSAKANRRDHTAPNTRLRCASLEEVVSPNWISAGGVKEPAGQDGQTQCEDEHGRTRRQAPRPWSYADGFRHTRVPRENRSP